MQATPRGPETHNCPFWQKPMSEVCHKCPLWTQIRGVHPQTGQDVLDEWNCALAHLPFLLIEASQMARQTGAATEGFRNLVAEAMGKAAVHKLTKPTDAKPPLLEHLDGDG